MNRLASRKLGDFSLIRHPRFAIGSSVLGALLALEFAAALVMGRLT
jgi:hypothetical protein